MPNEEDIQNRYMQFQMLQQQIEQVSQHAELLNQQNIELETSISALQEIEKIKINNEILAPIANGIFLKAELKDNQRLIVNVGGEITVEKTFPEVVKLLEEQKEEVTAKVMEAEEVLQQLQYQAMKIYEEVEKETKTEKP
ncbi:MAG: prefoldin subunit alpha [Nanoarchaeota archaeon]|nr:prefoldin subunit alpha [Nanoarchaeota archaeon]MBU1632390.1 prefoldin subunit alpha [Nanoarchaeota archaeon]MBU1876694.1 prefoldin subunit alpha [Nanoarchaeota archaeon]